ncbi:hypothetical protein HG530_006433 [Fusarium avenaceum]|nr:hypothetical protein HG530_006433 [Fusarium avenaceum]
MYVVLIVQQEVLVILSHPTLVGVGSAVVCGARQLARHSTAGDVNNSEGIFVVVEADFTTLEGLLGTTVDHALGIVHVAIRRDTASILGPLWVRDINHPEASTTLEIVGCTDGGNEGCLLVSHKVVAVAKSTKVCGQVTPDAEGGRVLDISIEKLTVLIKDTGSRLALAEGHLSLAELFHSNGIRRTGGTQVTLIELGRVDPLVLGNRRARQGGKEDGGDTGLHIDRMDECAKRF